MDRFRLYGDIAGPNKTPHFPGNMSIAGGLIMLALQGAGRLPLAGRAAMGRAAP